MNSTSFGNDLSNNLENLNDYNIWNIVKTSKSKSKSDTKEMRNFWNGISLSEGDVLKLGRVRFRVKEIFRTKEEYDEKRSEEKHQENLKVEKNSDKNPIVSESLTEKSQILCRICLSTIVDTDEDFIEPCKCSGSMKYVHIKCLQTWNNSKLKIKENSNVKHMHWKGLECELCKKPYECFI